MARENSLIFFVLFIMFFFSGENCFAAKKIEENPKKITLSETQAVMMAASYYGMGTAALKNNNNEKAILYLEQAIKLNPDFYQAYNVLGKTYGLVGRFDDAIKTLKRSMEIRSGNDTAYVNLAVVYHKMRDIEKAIQACETATIINSSSISAHSILGILYLITSDETKAMQELNISINLSDNFVKSGFGSMVEGTGYFENCYMLGQLYSKKEDFARAIEMFEKAKDGYFADPNFYSLLGNAYIKTGDYDLAIENFKYGINFAPDEPSFAYNIACAYAKKGDKTESLKWLERAIKKYPIYKDSAKTDPDFQNIKDLEEFKKLTQKNSRQVKKVNK